MQCAIGIGRDFKTHPFSRNLGKCIEAKCHGPNRRRECEYPSRWPVTLRLRPTKLTIVECNAQLVLGEISRHIPSAEISESASRRSVMVRTVGENANIRRAGL